VCVCSLVAKSDQHTYVPASDPDLVFITVSDKWLRKAFLLDGRGRVRLDIVKQAFGVTSALEIIISKLSYRTIR